jgi:hypothetical protein
LPTKKVVFPNEKGKMNQMVANFWEIAAKSGENVINLLYFRMVFALLITQNTFREI